MFRRRRSPDPELLLLQGQVEILSRLLACAIGSKAAESAEQAEVLVGMRDMILTDIANSDRRCRDAGRHIIHERLHAMASELFAKAEETRTELTELWRDDRVRDTGGATQS